MSLNLTAAGLADQKAWEAAGYALPSYDREAMITRTKESPCWVHFGAGNIFRAFQANTAQELLNNGTFDRGVIVAEGFDTEIIRDMYQPHDNLSILVTLKADGSVEKTVVGSIAESLAADTADSPDFARLKEIFTKDSLQMATFTITEKGYSLKNGASELLPSVAADFAAGPSSVTSYMGKVASLLYERFLAGEKPVAMVSTDNCSHNGEKLSLALTAYASVWEENKLVQPGFLSYLQNPEKVSFPWTMIDKITPRPDGSIEKILEENGLADAQPIVTSRHTYVAPFVNAEECQYLVVEDHFPNGRPPMEKSGWIFTDRETVNKTERMKVCTCLNPLHTALAVFGCLLDYELISEHPRLVSLEYTESLRDKLEICDAYDECANTDIQAVFQLILDTAVSHHMKQDDLPKNILILSDMEFDAAVRFPGCRRWEWEQSDECTSLETLFEKINRAYEAQGYQMPRLVFWNLCSRTNTVPLQQNEAGVALVSGFSPVVYQMVLSNELDPYRCLLEQLNAKRYDAVGRALK